VKKTLGQAKFELMECSNWTLGDHWSLLLVTRAEELGTPLFIHIDSMANDKKGKALNVLIEQIKEHMSAVCIPEIETKEGQDEATRNLQLSKTFHSDKVKTIQQNGTWECGYFMMHMIDTLTKANCLMLSTLTTETLSVSLLGYYKKYNTVLFRKGMALRALDISAAQRDEWITQASSLDSTMWIACHILQVLDYAEGGKWYRLSYQIAKNTVRIWCQLPTQDCLYWKHTN
jgi:hypothetical protein